MLAIAKWQTLSRAKHMCVLLGRKAVLIIDGVAKPHGVNSLSICLFPRLCREVMCQCIASSLTWHGLENTALCKTL